jgi:hypothetical protein
MNHAALLAQMHQHHQGVAEYVLEAGAIIGADTLDPAAVSTIRWRFVRVLTGYQLFKHQQIFDPVVQHGSMRDADAARQLKAECILISEAFRNYVARWSASGITGREAEYRHDAQAMIARVQAHITRERRGIEALLARSTRTA